MNYHIFNYEIDDELLELANKELRKKYNVILGPSPEAKDKTYWSLYYYGSDKKISRILFLGKLSSKSLSLLSNPRLNGEAYRILTTLRNFLGNFKALIIHEKKEVKNSILGNDILDQSLDDLNLFTESILNSFESDYKNFIKLLLKLRNDVKILRYSMDTFELHKREKDYETKNKTLVLINQFQSIGDEYFQ